MEALRFQEEFLSADRLLYRIAWSYLGNLQDVEDAVQTTLVKAWEKRKKLRSSEQFRPWIVRILINVCKDELESPGVTGTVLADSPFFCGFCPQISLICLM